MTLLDELSSSKNERSEQANRRVVAIILENPYLIEEIIDALQTRNIKLLGDCVEVCTMVAENDPRLIAPHTDQLFRLLTHKNTRVRWEAMHALALITPNIPDELIKHWEGLALQFLQERSVIVRDYIVICAGNLAASNQANALLVYPFLLEALEAYNTHHAKLALEGFSKGLAFYNNQKQEISEIADLFSQHPKPSIKKAARQLVKRLSE